MTISTTTANVSYVGNGATTTFSYAFEVPYQADGVTPAVRVTTTVTATGAVTVLTNGVDYSISGVGTSGGGTVTYPLSGSPLASTSYISIFRAPAETQPYSFPNTAFLPANVEAMGDWIVMMIQAAVQNTVAQTLGDGTNQRTITFGGAAPTTGTYKTGDIVFNSLVSGAGQTLMWVCTVAGTPGTWVAKTL